MGIKLVTEYRKGRSKAARHRQKYWFDRGLESRQEHLFNCDDCFRWQVERVANRRIREWEDSQKVLFDSKRVIEGWKVRH